MLEAMRRNTKVILWITIIFFILLIFLVWGADLQFGNEVQPNVAGKVNGELISISDYQQVLAASRSNARAQGRELTPSDELFLEEQAWNGIVEETLLRQEAERRGLRARDAEIRSILLNTPPDVVTQDPTFHNEQGQFDLASFRAILQSPTTPETYLLQLEAYVRATLPLTKLRNLVVSSVKVTEDELRRAFLEQNETAAVTHVLVDGGNAAVKTEVTDAELEAWFQENASRYRQPRRVTLRYVTIPRAATAADSADLRAELSEIAAESRRAEQSAAAGKEDLENNDFITNILTFSDGPFADDGGLRPGYVPVGSLSPPIQAVVETLEPGTISEPILDRGFYHLVRIDSTRVTEDGVREVRLRELSLRIDASDETMLEARETLEAVLEEARSGGLAKAATARGLTVQEVPGVARTGIVPGLTALPQASQFAHGNPEGTVSRVLSTNSAWYVLEVGPALPPGVPALDEVRSQARADLLRERRLAAGRNVAESLVSRVRAGSTLEEVAAADSLSLFPSPAVTRRNGLPALGRAPEAVAAVFGLPVGQVSDPIETDRGWVVLRVDSREPVDWGAFEAQRDALQQSLLSSKQARAYTAFLEQLRDRARISDLRT